MKLDLARSVQIDGRQLFKLASFIGSEHGSQDSSDWVAQLQAHYVGAVRHRSLSTLSGMEKQLAQNPHKLFRLLSDKTRLRIVCLLQQQSLCVIDLMEIIGMRQPAISGHLRQLKRGGLVTVSEHWRWNTYSLVRDTDPTTTTVLNALKTVRRNSRQLLRDAKRLKSKPRPAWKAATQ